MVPFRNDACFSISGGSSKEWKNCQLNAVPAYLFTHTHLHRDSGLPINKRQTPGLFFLLDISVKGS